MFTSLADRPVKGLWSKCTDTARLAIVSEPFTGDWALGSYSENQQYSGMLVFTGGGYLDIS